MIGLAGSANNWAWQENANAQSRRTVGTRRTLAATGEGQQVAASAIGRTATDDVDDETQGAPVDRLRVEVLVRRE